MKRISVAAVFLALLVTASALSAQTNKIKLLGDFEDGWRENWIERQLRGLPTSYEVVEEDSNKVLQAYSEKSSSGLWHMLKIRLGSTGKISWRWKVDKVLSKDHPEKAKRGDDYAARVFVVFEPHYVSWKTRAICYVWAASQRAGSTYSNPYAESLKTIAVRSGDKDKKKWVNEERNLIADYIELFGKPPTMLTAVAIMVDTDNTNQHVTTYFDDITLEVSPPEARAANSEATRSESNR